MILKLNLLITITLLVFSINGINITLRNYQLHIGNTNIEYSLLNLFILNIVSSIFNGFLILQLVFVSGLFFVIAIFESVKYQLRLQITDL